MADTRSSNQPSCYEQERERIRTAHQQSQVLTGPEKAIAKAAIKHGQQPEYGLPPEHADVLRKAVEDDKVGDLDDTGKSLLGQLIEDAMDYGDLTDKQRRDGRSVIDKHDL